MRITDRDLINAISFGTQPAAEVGRSEQTLRALRRADFAATSHHD